MEGEPASPFAASDDCLRAAREAADPQTALLYYAAAEAAGVTDPALCRERDRILLQLGDVELRFLNARCGSWRDPPVLEETASALQAVQFVPSDFPDTIDGLDAAALMEGGQYRRALQMCRFLVQRQRAVPFACFLAGCCMQYTPGEEATALTWLNLAEQLGSGSTCWINLTRAGLLRRVNLPWLALDQLRQLDGSGLTDGRSLAAAWELVGHLLGVALLPSPHRDALLQALGWVREAQQAYFERSRAASSEPAPQSAARRIFEVVLAGNLEAAGNLLCAGSTELAGEVFGILSEPKQPAIAVRRALQLMLAMPLIEAAALDRVREHSRLLDPGQRSHIEFVGQWREQEGAAALPAGARIAALLAAHLTHPAGRVHLVLDDPAIYHFLRASGLADEITLQQAATSAASAISTAETVIVLISREDGIAPISLPPAADLLLLLAPALPDSLAGRFAGSRRVQRVEQIDLSGWSLWVARGGMPELDAAGGWRPADDEPLLGADRDSATQAARLAADLWEASRTRRPFSFIRLIHAETRFLGLCRDLPENAVPFRPSSFFMLHLGVDPSTLAPGELRAYQDEFHSACLDADILLTCRRSAGEENGATITERVMGAYPGYAPYLDREVPTGFQVYVLECGALLRTLADRRVLLIGNPAPRFRELLADTEYRARFKHLGMPQARIEVVKSLFVPHQGDLAFRSLERLWEEVALQAFDVALISASLTGKLLAGRIKKYLGRMALDIGYTMQLLASSPSRVAAVDIEAARKRGYRRALAAA